MRTLRWSNVLVLVKLLFLLLIISLFNLVFLIEEFQREETCITLINFRSLSNQREVNLLAPKNNPKIFQSLVRSRSVIQSITHMDHSINKVKACEPVKLEPSNQAFTRSFIHICIRSMFCFYSMSVDNLPYVPAWVVQAVSKLGHSLHSCVIRCLLSLLSNYICK